MNNPLGKAYLARLLMLSLVITALLSACSKPEPVDSIPTTTAQYEIKEIRYFFNQGDRVDTTTLQLEGSSVQNSDTLLSTQQVEEDLGELVKTSRFIIDSTIQLPKEVDLLKFAVSVPEYGYDDGSFGRSIETYSLSAVEQQKPYGFYPKRMVTVKIPPKSRIDISRQITAYHLICSFDGILENTTTGQRYRLKGKWKGLLQYVNPVITLKESAL